MIRRTHWEESHALNNVVLLDRPRGSSCWADLRPNQKALANDDVLQMVKAGFEQSMVVKAIEANDTNFDLSVQALMDLKNAGVSQTIIEAMLAAEAKKKAPDPAEKPARESSDPGGKAKGADPLGLPDEVGVYVFKAKGVLVAMEPEIVTWRTGGVFKAMASGGLTKGHVNGVVRNKQAHCNLPRLLSSSSAAQRAQHLPHVRDPVS